MAAGLAVGALYSLPPFRLKRYPVAASLCISGVRSVVVNLGVYWHFAGQIAPPVIALCLFVLPFCLAIAMLKDVPDIEGDRRYSIHTSPSASGRAGLPIGLAALSIAYAGMIVLGPPLLADYTHPVVLAVGHLAAAVLLWYWARTAIRAITTEFTRFYMRVWALFFLEYLLVPAACLTNWLNFDVRARTNPHGWPVWRGHPRMRGVGLSAMSIASAAESEITHG